MSRPKTLLLAALGAAAAAAVAAAAWLGAADPPASRLAFDRGGTDLRSGDVQGALSELAARVKAVESAQEEIRSSSAAQASRLGAVAETSTDQALRMAGHEARVATLEKQVAEGATFRTRLDYADGAAAAVTPEYARLREVGTFVKRGARSAVLLVWNTHVDAEGAPGTFCDFQLRVDGAPDHPSEGGGGRAVVYVPPGAQAGVSQVSVAALFGRVGAGAHAVAVFVRGTAARCQENYGNFPRSVLVEETPP